MKSRCYKFVSGRIEPYCQNPVTRFFLWPLGTGAFAVYYSVVVYCSILEINGAEINGAEYCEEHANWFLRMNEESPDIREVNEAEFALFRIMDS